MERFIQSIENSVKSENWYSALTLALTIPDICGRLYNPSSGSRKRFEEWFNEYMLHHYTSPFHGEGFTFLSGADCYALRCAFLHEGSNDIMRQKAREVVSKFAFSTTGSHKCMFNDILLLHLPSFCNEVCEGARKWLINNQENPEVQKRMQELLHIHTEGFMVATGIYVE